MEWRRCPVPMPDTDVSPLDMLEKIECLLLNMIVELSRDTTPQLGTLCALDKPRKYTMLYDAPSSTCFEQSRVATVLKQGDGSGSLLLATRPRQDHRPEGALLHSQSLLFRRTSR